MKKLLLIIDLQNDFINENTKNIPNHIKDLILKEKYDYIAFTQFINDVDSNFYLKLKYEGCMTNIGQKIAIDTLGYPIFQKKIYTALNEELKQFIKKNDIEKIYLCGIDTDACVLKTAIDLFENNLDVKVIEDCCMSHSGREYHNYAISMLKKLIGNQNVINVLRSVNKRN